MLAFESRSHDSSDAYLTVGFEDEISGRLSEVARLTIISPGVVRHTHALESMPLEQVGRALRARYLVLGSFQRVGRRLRVSVQLMRAETGQQLWAESYDNQGDALEIQTDVALRVATAILARLLPGERTTLAAAQTRNPEAWDHFQRGNFYLAKRTERASVLAIEEYQHALDLDPAFVQGRAHLACAFATMLDWGWSLEGAGPDSLLALGTAAADRAIAEDPRSSDGWVARGWLLEFRTPRTFDGVVAAFERALELDPRNAEAWHVYGATLERLGRDSAAVVADQRALRIDPARPVTLQYLAALAYRARHQFAEVLYWVDSALAVDPTFAFGLSQRSMYRIASGDLAGAQADAEAAIRAGAPSLQAVVNLTILVALRGDTARARASLDSLSGLTRAWRRLDFRTGVNLARGYAALGDFDHALEVLERAEPRGLALGLLLRTPALDALRPLPRFQRLVAETRPPESR